jgi:hypothetical protein
VDEQHFTVSDEVLAAVDAGRKIEAIKILREESGLGLKDAKQVVDSLAGERRVDPVIAAGMVEEGGAGSLIKCSLSLRSFLLRTSIFSPGSPFRGNSLLPCRSYSLTIGFELVSPLGTGNGRTESE